MSLRKKIGAVRIILKIAFDHQIFSLQSYGGISRYFVTLVNQLVKLEQEPKIFAGFYQNKFLSSVDSKNIFGRYLKKIPQRSERLLFLLNHFLTSRKIKEWKPDVIHSTYYSLLEANYKDCYRIATVHDMIHELFPNLFPFYDKTRHWKKKSLREADHIISISENTKKDLINILGISPEKVTVIHHGFDFSVFERKEVCKFSFIKPYLLYVGPRAGYKNFYSFLKAISTSKNLMNDFNVITFSNLSFSPKEIIMIEKMGFSKNQVQNISGDDRTLSSLYQSASAFVYPSLYEGFGIPPLEAMAAGCPVLSSNSGSMPEILGDAAVYFDPNQLDDIKTSIEKVVYSEYELKLLKIKGLNNIKKYSLERCAQATLDVYKKALNYD